MMKFSVELKKKTVMKVYFLFLQQLNKPPFESHTRVSMHNLRLEIPPYAGYVTTFTNLMRKTKAIFLKNKQACISAIKRNYYILDANIHTYVLYLAKNSPHPTFEFFFFKSF